jgi:hypothetical protein
MKGQKKNTAFDIGGMAKWAWQWHSGDVEKRRKYGFWFDKNARERGRQRIHGNKWRMEDLQNDAKRSLYRQNMKFVKGRGCGR